MIKKLSSLVLFSFILLSCSGDDDSGNNNQGGDTNYLPEGSSQTWTYNYTQVNRGQEEQGQNTVSYGSTVNANGESYTQLQETSKLTGLDNVTPIRKQNNNIFIDAKGTLTDADAVGGESISLSFGDFKILDESKDIGSLLQEGLSQFTGSPQNIPSNPQNIQGTVTPEYMFKLESYYQNQISSVTVSNEVYENVYQSQLKLYVELKYAMALNASGQSFNFTHTLAEMQQYGTLNIWWAPEVGIVKTEYNYDFSNLTLDTTIETILGNYDINDFIPNVEQLIANAVDLNGSAELN